MIGAAVCVRLGLWQLERRAEKQAQNAAQAAAMASPPLAVEGEPPPWERVRGRRVQVTGRYDESRQILLTARFHVHEPGVEVVTPFVLDGGGVVLVNRGWLPAADAVSRDPAEFPEPGLHDLVGVAEPVGRGLRQGMQRAASSAPGREVWTASALDLDSLAVRDGRPFAGWVLRQLPGPGLGEWPKRRPPEPHDEGVHLGYAAQWFLFGAALVAAPFVIARLRRGRSIPDRPVRSA